MILRILHSVGLFAAAIIVGLVLGGVENALGATNQAVTCPGITAGKPRSACPVGGQRYATPVATTMVRALSLLGAPTDTWQPFGVLASTDLLQACTAPDIPEGSASDKDSGAPCTDWANVTKASIAGATPQPPPVNTTGKMTLKWEPVSVCLDSAIEKPCSNADQPTWAVKGYRVYSGVSPSALTLLTTTSPAATQVDVSGYGNGTYYFGLTAFNGDGEGPMSRVVSMKVEKPATTPVRATPKQVEGVALTVTF